MSEWDNVVDWLTDPDNWQGDSGIPVRMWETVQHCFWALLVATLIAIPLAVVLAHYRRGQIVATWTFNSMRAVPTFAVVGLVWLVSVRAGWGFEPWPILVGLVLLALPPIFINAYAAVANVEPGAIEAARGMGYPERSIMGRIELPLALPVVFVGLRIAAVQVVATEPVGAIFAGGGVGRFIVRGASPPIDEPVLYGGAILATALAVAVAGLFTAAERVLVPRSVRHAVKPRRARRRAREPEPSPA